jgi:hypothetical protein
MSFSWGNLGETLLGGALTALSPFTGGLTGAIGAPMMSQGIGGMLANDPERQKRLLQMPQRPVVNPVQTNDYVDAIRRLSEG